MKQNEYDVIIIGAGIGGLVCGCLLAKAGMKVLIAEKNSIPGGYCTSFKSRNYEFDAFVHSLGNLADGAQFSRLLEILKIKDEIGLIQHNPTDTIISPEIKVSYWADVQNTVDDFCRAFPREKNNIYHFFLNLINEMNMEAVVHFRNKTFRQLLDEIFEDDRLKELLSLVILGNLGTPAYHINAFTAVKHYRQFMIDGGYYPKDGIQVLPNAFARRFKELGGKLLLSSPAEKILVENKIVVGVELKNIGFLNSKFVVSGCDARQTFLSLIGKEFLSDTIVEKLEKMKPSLSLFVVYLGFKEETLDLPPDGVNTWVISDYSYAKSHLKNIDVESDQINWLLIRPNYQKRNCMIFTHAPYRNPEFWKENRRKFMSAVIEKAKSYFPKLLEHRIFENAADPSILSNWTMNYHGSGYGWAATVEQFMDPDFSRDGVIKNLFLCGHWSTVGQGVEGVAILGERVANIIVNSISISCVSGK